MLENYKLTIMKELSVEEKAKRYDEAIKRAGNLHKDAVEMENNMTSKTCEIIFPELAESDDEWIKDDIKDVIQAAIIPKESKREMLAWLEKQGKQKQTWKPSAAQLIVIKDLIEDENTSKVNKVILRGMFDEFEHDFGL